MEIKLEHKKSIQPITRLLDMSKSDMRSFRWVTRGYVLSIVIGTHHLATDKHDFLMTKIMPLPSATERILSSRVKPVKLEGAPPCSVLTHHLASQWKQISAGSPLTGWCTCTCILNMNNQPFSGLNSPAADFWPSHISNPDTPFGIAATLR